MDNRVHPTSVSVLEPSNLKDIERGLKGWLERQKT